MEMEEKIVAVPGGNIPYIIAGSGPTLLFLHGAIATPRAYIPLLEHLAEHFSVIAPTHPGHGDAFALGPQWKIENFLQTYTRFFGTLSYTPEIIVGHSFGATLALLLAARGVGSRVIAMDPPGLPFALTAGAYVAAKAKEIQELLAYSYNQTRMGETLSAAGTLLYTARHHPENIPWISRRIPRMNIEHAFGHIRIPVHLLWGEHDGIVPLSVGEQMVAHIHQATLTVVPHKGHNYPVTDPAFTYNEIMKILMKI